MKGYLLILFTLLLFEEPSFGFPLSRKVTQAGFSGNNADAIAYVGSTFKLPLVAEVVFKPNEQTIVPVGELSAAEALQIITKQAGEKWESSDGTVHVYTPNVLSSARNALGYYFTSITVPPKPSGFKYIFEAKLNAAAAQAIQPHGVYGIATSGIVSTELDGVNASCIPGTFEDINARRLLLREVVPARLMVIMLFPSGESLTASAVWTFVENNSFWLAISDPLRKLPIQLSIAKAN